MADTQRLVQQLGMAKQKLEAAKAALQAFKWVSGWSNIVSIACVLKALCIPLPCRDESLKHVNEQLAHNDQLRAMLQSVLKAA